MRLKFLCAVALGLSLPMIANANEPSSDWRYIARSHTNDFNIYCKDGNKDIWGIYPRGGVSEYQVAREIYVRQLPNGQTQLSLMRGYIVADKVTTYIPAVGVSCEISEK